MIQVASIETTQTLSEELAIGKLIAIAIKAIIQLS